MPVTLKIKEERYDCALASHSKTSCFEPVLRRLVGFAVHVNCLRQNSENAFRQMTLNVWFKHRQQVRKLYPEDQ